MGRCSRAPLQANRKTFLEHAEFIEGRLTNTSIDIKMPPRRDHYVLDDAPDFIRDVLIERVNQKDTHN